MAESMAESECWKAGKGGRSGRSGSLVCFLMLLNLALDLRGKERGRWIRLYYSVLLRIILLFLGAIYEYIRDTALK